MQADNYCHEEREEMVGYLRMKGGSTTLDDFRSQCAEIAKLYGRRQSRVYHTLGFLILSGAVEATDGNVAIK